MNTYYPQWAKAGCKVIKTWREPVKSGSATGVKTLVQYTQGGKTHECMKWVVWDN